jgi:hypothetical protein
VSLSPAIGSIIRNERGNIRESISLEAGCTMHACVCVHRSGEPKPRLHLTQPRGREAGVIDENFK